MNFEECVGVEECVWEVEERFEDGVEYYVGC